MPIQVIHISTAEAERNFAAVLRHLRAGREVVVERGTHLMAVMRPVAPPPANGKNISAKAPEVLKDKRETVPQDLAETLEQYIYATSNSV
jgi:antitoxin (DNA-binding transcriptional repressor) of toxin-antitoxin stability system